MNLKSVCFLGDNTCEPQQFVDMEFVVDVLSIMDANGGVWTETGFSNGGTVVLELARRFIGMQRLGGIVAVSASFLRGQRPLLEQSSVAEGIGYRICGPCS